MALRGAVKEVRSESARTWRKGVSGGESIGWSGNKRSDPKATEKVDFQRSAPSLPPRYTEEEVEARRCSVPCLVPFTSGEARMQSRALPQRWAHPPVSCQDAVSLRIHRCETAHTRADCTKPLYVRDLSICRFWSPRGISGTNPLQIPGTKG